MDPSLANVQGYIEGRRQLYERMLHDYPNSEAELRIVLAELTMILLHIDRIKQQA